MHVIQRGSRGLLIVRDKDEKLRFVRGLCYLNDKFRDPFWDKITRKFRIGDRPESWPEKKPLCDILAWTLLPNHFHLILRETSEGGISKFMQKLCGSMSTYSNLKYQEKGSIFQGSYRGKTAELRDDTYLKNLFIYVLVKNTLECHPKGLAYALKNFNDAFEWAISCPYSSVAEFLSGGGSLICTQDAIDICFNSAEEFKSYAKEVMLKRLEDLDEDFAY